MFGLRYQNPRLRVHRSDGAVRPRVARVAAPELAANRRVVALPEAREVRRDLDGAVVRREQMEDERGPPVGDLRPLTQAEEVLEARRDPRRLSALVVHLHAARA